MPQRGLGWPEAAVMVALFGLLGFLFYGPTLSTQAAQVSSGVGFGLVVGFLVGAALSLLFYRDLRAAQSHTLVAVAQASSAQVQAAKMQGEVEIEKSRADRAEGEIVVLRRRLTSFEGDPLLERSRRQASEPQAEGASGSVTT
jgi:hypothetical protein